MRPQLRLVVLAACGLLYSGGQAAGRSDPSPVATPVSIAALGAPGGVSHEQLSGMVDGVIVGRELLDLDADGRIDLMLSVLARNGQSSRRRSLQLYRQTASGRFPSRPDLVVAVPADVIAWAGADVRDEPGRELLFLTRSGVWSYSTTRSGWRGNAHRLVQLDLLFDRADPESLPRWRYVLERDGKDLLLLPGKQGCSVWGPGGEGQAYVQQLFLPAADRSDERAGLASDPEQETRLRVGDELLHLPTHPDPDQLFVPEEIGVYSMLLASAAGMVAPAVLDVDGDGRPDLVFQHGDDLTLHRADAGGLPGAAPQLTMLPAATGDPDRRGVRLVDMDGDGTRDLLLSEVQPGGTWADDMTTLSVLINDGTGGLPTQVRQVLRLQGARVDAWVADVDGDGRSDLTVTKYELPGLTDVVTGRGFRRTTLVFLGRSGPRPFADHPALTEEQEFDLDHAREAVVKGHLTQDMDGDGLADMVEVDLGGHVVVRRLVHESSFFGGDSWSLEQMPMARYELPGDLRELIVADLNGDGVGDLLSTREERFSIVLSRRVGK